eukprot:74671_1
MSVLCTLLFAINTVNTVHSYSYSLDGSNNNLDHPEWGTPGRLFRRLPNEYKKLTYSDGHHQMNTHLPNARILSNSIGQTPKSQSKFGKYAPLSGIAWVVSKTMAQELCATKGEVSPDTFHPIKVPPCDWYWDGNCTNEVKMPFWRNPFKNQTTDNSTYATPFNMATNFIDLDYIYGTSIEAQNKVRIFKNGLIKTTNLYAFNTSDELIDAQLDHTGFVTSTDANAHSIKRFYDSSLRNDRSFGGIESGISGYTTNECPFLAGESTTKNLIQHLWHLNHNRIARELADELNTTDDEYLFQEARVRQIATAQHILYTEYLPLFLAFPIINEVQYDPSIDPQASTWFCGLAHRYAHPATPNRIPFGGYHNENEEATYGGYANEILSSVTIREAINYPCIGIDDIKNRNQSDNVYVESMLSGLMLESENELSPKHNEFVRSFLTRLRHSHKVTALHEGAYDTDHQIDLFATDLMRTRDWGMPSYNDARELFNLSRVESWEELTDDEWYLEALPRLYNSIDDLDAYVGGLIEEVEAEWPGTPDGSGHIGPLFAAILRDQYWRLAAGDRFFYAYNETLRNYTESLTLSKIIELNTNLKNLSTDIFTTDSKNMHSQNTQSQTQSISLLEDAVYFEWSLDLAMDTITFTFELYCGTECDIGWIGIGFGEGEFMKGKDIIRMIFDHDEMSVIDSYCPNDRWLPIPDPDRDETNEGITFISSGNSDGIITFSFKRALVFNKDNEYDYPIDVHGGEQCCVIVAYNLGSIEGKHSTNSRTPIMIDWTSGEYNAAEDTTRRVRLTHGILMISLFGVAYPISAFIGHYFKHMAWARQYHKLSGKLGLPTAATSAFFAISTVVKHGTNRHEQLGIACLLLLCATAMIGFTLGFWLDHLKRNWWYNKLKYAHALFAVSILFISPFCIWCGWQQHGLYHNRYVDAEYGFMIFYGLVISLMIGGEIYQRLSPKLNNKTDFNQFNYHIFDWSEIGEKVSAGAAWIIIEGVIYDVSEWQYAHPGGRRVLLHFFGTDCTALFNGERGAGEEFGNIRNAHSGHSRKQLLTMVVGEVLSDTNTTRTIQRKTTHHLASLDVCIDGDYDRQAEFAYLEEISNARKLTASKCIGRTVVSTKKGKRQLVLLEFNYDILEHGICFDGDYVLLHQVDKHTITRAYTPIDPKFILCNNDKYYTKNRSLPIERRLFIMVRIYPNGRMSEVLNKLRVGHSLRITGPFRREQILPPPPNTDEPKSPNRPTTHRGHLEDLLEGDSMDFDVDSDYDRNALQRANTVHIETKQYWKRMVLIAGGTGITPMLNMIRYHLDSSDDEIHVSLIWHNRTVNDVCFEEQLKYYQKENRHRFWIDLKFDVAELDVELPVNESRLEWARLHTRNWSLSHEIQMVEGFMKSGIPLTSVAETKSRATLQKKMSVNRKELWASVGRNGDNLLHTSFDFSSENLFDAAINTSRADATADALALADVHAATNMPHVDTNTDTTHAEEGTTETADSTHPETTAGASEDVIEDAVTNRSAVEAADVVLDEMIEMMNNLTDEEEEDDDVSDTELKKKNDEYENTVIILSGPRPFTEKVHQAFLNQKPDLFKHIICLD